MIITNRNIRSFGIVFLLGGLWAGFGQASAAAQEGSSVPSSVASGQDESLWDMPLCSPPGQFWLRSDYLMWWTSGTRLPPLVTTSPQGTPAEQAGVLPGATILYGDQTIGNDGRSGYRTTLGMWLDANHIWDVQGDYFMLGQGSQNFRQMSTGDPILARPFYNVETGLDASELVAYPGLVAGTIAIDFADYFQSAGILVGYQLVANDSSGSSQNVNNRGSRAPLTYGNRFDLLGGFRYFNLGDRLSIAEDHLITQAGPLQDTTFRINDNFRANNNFYGAEIGFRTHAYRGRWSLDFLTKLALGTTHRTVTIDGQTVIATPGQPTQTYNAGILALGTNSGTHQQDDFTVIPQLGVELGYQLSDHWRTYFGYNLLYWGRVARSADQIDLNVDPRNFPPPQAGGTSFPAFTGQTSTFWAQGVNLGAEFRF